MIALGEIQLVRLEGAARERGRAAGETLRSLIAAGMEHWKASLHEATDVHPEDYLERFVERTDFLPAIERWAPDLLEEVRGIGEGADLSFRDAYAYQLMDEEWLFRCAQTREREGPNLHHCSVVGVFGEGAPSILAQNMDLPKVYDGTQTLLYIRHAEPGPESLVFTPAGLIGTAGLNNAGLGVCVNTLGQLRSSVRGLPVAFIMRRVLEHRTLEEAVDFVRRVPHAAGQNYAIGDSERIIDLECSAGGAVQFSPPATRVYHTNHPLVNDDQALREGDATAAPFGKGAGAADRDMSALSDSEQRFAFLQRALGDPSERISVEAVKAILSACEVPISMARTSAGTGMTLGSLVMELSRPPVLHLAPGPPAETAYRTWTFGDGGR